MSDRNLPMYLRNDAVVLIRQATRLLQVSPDGTTVLWNKNIEPLCDLADLFSRPNSPQKAAEHIGRSLEEAQRMIQILVKAGILIPFEPVTDPYQLPARSERLCKRMVLGISGSIQAAWMLTFAMTLKAHFADKVDVILTQAATHFLPPSLLENLGFMVWHRIHESRGTINVPHVYLSEADLFAVIPASAHTIHRLATGACSDLLSLAATCTRAPVVIAPSMNENMLEASSVKRNIAQLRRDGFYIIETRLATEVSGGSCERTPGGIGVSETNILSALKAVLIAARTNIDEYTKPDVLGTNPHCPAGGYSGQETVDPLSAGA